MIYRMKVGALKRAARPSADLQGSAYACAGDWARLVAARLRARADRIERSQWSEGRQAAVMRLERVATRLADLKTTISGALAQIDARKPDAEVELTFATHYVSAR